MQWNDVNMCMKRFGVFTALMAVLSQVKDEKKRKKKRKKRIKKKEKEEEEEERVLKFDFVIVNPLSMVEATLRTRHPTRLAVAPSVPWSGLWLWTAPRSGTPAPEFPPEMHIKFNSQKTIDKKAYCFVLFSSLGNRQPSQTSNFWRQRYPKVECPSWCSLARRSQGPANKHYCWLCLCVCVSSQKK